MAMHATPWKEFAGGKERIRSTYGMDEQFAQRNNQAPHISVTGEIEEKDGRGRWRDVSFGQLHTEIAKHFPQLRNLIPWHLVAEPGVPMHYLANGQYWWEFIMGTGKGSTPSTNPVAAFKNTILYGILPGDTDLEFMDAEAPPWAMLEGEPAPEDIRPWLKTRLPGLQKGFDKVVRDYDLKGSTRAHNPGPTSAAMLVGRLKF